MITLEEVHSADGKLIAIIIKNDFNKDGINFISKSDFPLQLGINSYPRGSKIKPHVHIDKETVIKNLQEVIYIKKGRVLVDLYDFNKILFKTCELSTGDLIFFVSGGHGFDILKDTAIIEIKQGPYFGKEQDKVMIE
jgi:hypothetical protein